MKKFLTVLMTGALCLSLLAGCGGSSSSSSSSGSSDAAAEEGTPGELTGTLKLGDIGPLTGAAAIYGNAASNGEHLAVDEINLLGGVQIELNSQDDEHDAEKSVNAYNNLKDWGAQAIVGCVTTTPCVAVSAEAYSDRMFMLTPSASSTSVTEGKDNVFQLCFSDPNQGTASAQYISDNALGTKIAIIYNNSDAYSTGIYQTFVAKANELGLDIVSETTFTDDTANDFSVQLTEAQKAGADLIFLPIYYTPASLILQQADKMGYAPTFFGVDGMDGILSLEGFDTSLAEGVMLLTPFSADATDERTVNFVASFKDQFGDTPSQFAADGYDCIYAMYDALTYYSENINALNLDDLSAEDLCDILITAFTSEGFTSDGLTGSGMTWTATGEVNKDPKAVVIQNGVYVGMDNN